jgi:hypothetical protein
VKVHDRDDVDAVRLDAIQKTVGKLRDQNAPEAATERGTSGREVEESFVRSLDRADEVESEPIFVELRCRNELVLGLRMNSTLLTEARSGLS